MHRASERIDLRSGVVDIIFLGDSEACGLEDAREAVADHRAAAMTHMQWTSRIGGDIFDVHALVAADGRQSVRIALVEDRPQLVPPRIGRQLQIDETRSGNLDRSHRRQRFELRLDRVRQSARVHPRAFSQNHRGVSGKIAVRGIARRLDRNLATIEVRRQRAVGHEVFKHSVEESGILLVKRHCPRLYRSPSRASRATHQKRSAGR